MSLTAFHNEILEGVPVSIPAKTDFDPAINHAPKRKEILSEDEK